MKIGKIFFVETEAQKSLYGRHMERKFGKLEFLLQRKTVVVTTVNGNAESIFIKDNEYEIPVEIQKEMDRFIKELVWASEEEINEVEILVPKFVSDITA